MRPAQIVICLFISSCAASIHPSVAEALSALRQTPSQPSHTPTFKDFDRKPATLSEEEFEALRGRVMTRCNVAPGTDPTKAPWYFHYELGLELEKRGDAQRALDALIEATNHRPAPRRNARMYGMWFTDYRPYFEIEKMHFALGNWQCSMDALKVSTGTREVTERDEEYIDLQELESALARQSN